MPVLVDGSAAQALGPGFDEAAELVRNEFSGLDPDRQYRNAFARLLKPDPLGRVLMMGTDQRDLFIPAVRAAVIGHVPEHGQLLDLGAGDGQTFALIAEAVPAGTTVSFEEPNPHYFADYSAALRRQVHLKPGAALGVGFDDLHDAGGQRLPGLPADESQHLVMALHMIYFLDDLPAGLVRMARFVRPGGALVIVVADETVAYTGRALRAFVAAGGRGAAYSRHLAAIAERNRLLAPAPDGGSALLALLQARLPDARFSLATERQPSRLYGHSLADIIALSNIAALAGANDLSKFDVACQLLRNAPESVDLRIEDEGPRAGMWSVQQPQLLAVLRRH